MRQTKKKLCANIAKSNSVHIKTANNNKDSIIKPPSKAESSITAFLKRNSMNTFEANQEYGDTCLHSCISDLNRKHGLVFNRRPETILNRVNKRVTVMRYIPANIEHMKQVLAKLQKARGLKI